jgi:rhodanese-related sulfurtransferase
VVVVVAHRLRHIPSVMPEDIDRHRLQALAAQQSAAIVEVLPADQYATEHLPNAISLPLGDLNAASAERSLGPDKRRAVVVYCAGPD